MKPFVWHTLLWAGLLLSSVAYVLWQADGRADPFYLKLSSPRQPNLILGTSKAAQGLQPHILQQELGTTFYNYAFALYASPYGRVYLHSIQQKLDTTVSDQTFILAVDAWSLCSQSPDPCNLEDFRENESFLAGLRHVNQHPNFTYLLRYFDGQYYQIIAPNTPALLHDDGWLDVSLEIDSVSLQRRVAFTLTDYRAKAERYRFSAMRLVYLQKTIEHLKHYGQVYLVRLPVHPQLMALETALLPDFEQKLQPACDLATDYVDLTSWGASFTYTDGIHLTQTSGKHVSRLIADWIQAGQSTKLERATHHHVYLPAQ